MNDNAGHYDTLKRHISSLKEENQHLKQSLQILKENLACTDDLIEYAVDAIFMGDGEGNITYANRSATNLTGYQNSELLAMNLGQLFSEEEKLSAPLQYDLLKRGETVKTERLLSRKDGSTVPVEMNSRMMPDGTYHSFFRDISERKRVDKALRISEKKFSRVFKLSPDAIALTRLADGMYMDVNQSFTDITGWTAEEAIGRTTLPEDLDIWCHSKDRLRLMAGLKKNGQVTGLEAEFRCKDGGKVIGLMSARIIQIDNESCLLTVTRDITGRIQELARQKSFEAKMLQVQKLESLGVLAGGIAHDFNNILTAVIGHCELAQQRLTAESPAMENLRQVTLAAGRATDLANQMLAYSGKGKFVIEIVNVSNVIKEMKQILSVSISKKAILQYDLANDLPTVEADITQLQQIVMNLVINGSDAIGSGNGVIRISTGVMDCNCSYLQEVWHDEPLSPGRYVFLEVADTGSGIAAEIYNRIFEPFFSTKFTGRGLGMAAVLGIVRGHNGAIKIYSEEGKGSTFKVLLPALSLPTSKKNMGREYLPLQGSGLVLLVDDEKTVRDIGEAILNDFGFETITANDGAEALTIFKEQHSRIRFVLMDLTMPHMDGEEAFRELRKIDSDVKVIICSGYNEQEVSQKFVGKGLAGFLKKPYQISALREMIQYILKD